VNAALKAWQLSNGEQMWTTSNPGLRTYITSAVHQLYTVLVEFQNVLDAASTDLRETYELTSETTSSSDESDSSDDEDEESADDDEESEEEADELDA
jgi:hypothetical protein